MRRGVKYLSLDDWTAVRDAGHVDPGPRPLDDVASRPLDTVPVVVPRQLFPYGFSPYGGEAERRERERRRAADAALEARGIKPKSWV